LPQAPFEIDLAGANAITLPADATITNLADDYAVLFENPATGTNSWTIGLDGSIGAFGGTGLVLYNWLATVNNKVTVGTEGAIAGLDTGLFSSTAADIINKGQIVGQQYGISFFGWAGANPTIQDGTGSNLNQLVAATSATKKISVDNQANATIGGEQVGIDNWSYAFLTVKNAGEIAGGAYDPDLDLLGDWGGAAINSLGGLNLNNAATGQIYGDVQSYWFGSVVTNAGYIEGTVNAVVHSIDRQVNDNGTLENREDDTVMIDLDHDGDFTDVAAKGAINAALAIKNTITNTGTINGNERWGWSSDEGPEPPYYQVALDLGYFNDAVTNSGEMFGEVWMSRGADSLTNSGLIAGHLDMGAGNDTVNNTGKIFENQTIDSAGVNLGSGTNTLTNAVGAVIEGRVRGGFGTDTVTNAGLITDGVELEDGKNTVTNSGFIKGDIGTGSGDDTVTNNLDVRGGIYVGGGLNKVTNTGHVFDDISADSGNDTITNNGRVDGSINAGDGNNVITNTGLVHYSINTGNAGTAVGQLEKITNSGTIYDSIRTGNGNREIINSGVVRNHVETGNGNDKFTNSKDVFEHVYLGDGNNTFINSGTVGKNNDLENDGFQSGNGADVVTNTGTIRGNVDVGDGDNTVTNSKVIRGSIFSGTAVNAVVGTVTKQETITNSGTLYGMISTGDGNRTITNSGIIYGEDVVFGGEGTEPEHVGIMTGMGNDTVTNSKSIYGDVLLAGGNDTFKNVAGIVFGGVALGMGTDPDGAGTLNKLENSGTIYGDIDGSNVVDTIKNTKTMLGDVNLYGGNDIVDNKTGTIRGFVDLGAGDDKYDGGAAVDEVAVGDGADTVTLGAGDDYLEALKDSFVDSYDGGVGTKDELDLSNSAVGVSIDMTTLVLGKGTITYAGEAAVDKAGGFEWFGATNSADVFKGSLTTAVNETIFGLAGSDLISGGRGKDMMFGGYGTDDPDGNADTFLFSQALDSGITTATRDVIGDFEVGLDKIWLAFDSDSTTAGFQAFEASDFLGVNTAFTGAKGDIRAIQVGMYLVVQADTTGDKKADFSVALGGDPVALQTLSASDFDFSLLS
jgi:hypothetical protein